MSPETYHSPRNACIDVVVALPVSDRPRIAFHPQRADLAVGHLAAVVVAQLDLEAVDDVPERAGHDLAGTVRQEDVPHLRGAEAVEQLDAERPLSSARSSSAGSASPADVASRSDRRSCSRGVGCATICWTIVGTLISTRRAMAIDAREHAFGRAALGEEHARGADRERKQHVRAQRVAEEQLRHRHRDVVGRQAEHALAVALGRVRRTTGWSGRRPWAGPSCRR